MKVLFVSNDPTIFDANSATRARMRSYAAEIGSLRHGGGELHIVSLAPQGAVEGQEGALFLHPIQALKLFRVYALRRVAREIILAHGIEVVSGQDPFEHGLAALQATEGTSAKLHIQVHTDFLSPWFVRRGNWRSPQVRMPFLNRMRCRIADRVLPRAHGIRVVSERIKESLIARYGSRPSEIGAQSHGACISEPTVIPVMVDANAPEPARLPAHPAFTFSLIAVGRLEPEKRIEDILAALSLVRSHYPMVGLVIVGEGRERKGLERFARSLELADKVIFLGNRPDARALMTSANAFIQASAYEGYGRTLVEAALAKVPIITTDVGIVGEVFRGFHDVLSVPVADPTALSLAIVGLIEDNTARRDLALHAEETARTHLTAVGDIPARIAEDLARLVA